MDANVSFTGNLGTEVEFNEGEDWAGARFRVAHTPRRLVNDTWVDGRTTWLSVRTSGRLARNCAASLRKGDPVVVSGRLRTKVWVDAEERERESLVVIASAVGHDLSRGSSSFTRSPRGETGATGSSEAVSPWELGGGSGTPSSPSSPEEDPGELTVDGERVDPVTGEVLVDA
ncbi:single-stranded DNA-binding protein [Acidipropionibacterium timonense]|uniref:single-stranded DNA-binding protein n=1 Tax=Acidipropionibacterium timonense TaxID=2161818 RepID=UPI001030BF46